MDILLTSIGILFLLAGFAGCILPGIPGPPISYIGLLLLHFTRYVQIDENTLLISGVITVVVTVLDNVVPIWGAKKFGGSKRGVWGSIIGLIVGMFMFPPFGIIVGPFAGAVLGELSGGSDNRTAFKAGMGAFIGFLAGTVAKLAVSGWLTWIFFSNMIKSW
jgi:uncharacterized protein